MIWSHTIVKNEDRYVWYSLMSAINWVDKMIVWDTGSTDKTREILEEIKQLSGDKVELKLFKEKEVIDVALLRQNMLMETPADWFLILDGDEIWWDESLKVLTDSLEVNREIGAFVSPYTNLVGDIFHFQEPEAGRYKIGKYQGNINLRLINRNIPGLHVEGKYPLEGYFDSNNQAIQDMPSSKLKYIPGGYLHTTFLQRSSDQLTIHGKGKSEIGLPFSSDYYYPEVFFRPKPTMVDSPWTSLRLQKKPLYFFAGVLRKGKREFYRNV